MDNSEVIDTESSEVVVVESDLDQGFELDGADPLVIVITWALTLAAGKAMVKTGKENLRKALPMVAVLIAVALRAGFDSVQGSELNAEVLLHGLSAAAIAVLGHSQVREFIKARQSE